MELIKQLRWSVWLVPGTPLNLVYIYCLTKNKIFWIYVIMISANCSYIPTVNAYPNVDVLCSIHCKLLPQVTFGYSLFVNAFCLVLLVICVNYRKKKNKTELIYFCSNKLTRKFGNIVIYVILSSKNITFIIFLFILCRFFLCK